MDTIPRQDDRSLFIEMLLDENDALRAALADLGADYVLLKVTSAKLLRLLLQANAREPRRQQLRKAAA